jgi:hypothetical protein
MAGSVESLLSPHLDEDTLEYITSLLAEDPSDEDAREAVEALISGNVEEEDTAEKLIQQLWKDLNASLSGGVSSNITSNNDDDDMNATTKRLDKAVTLKDHDVVTYAGGLGAADKVDKDGNATSREGGSGIQSFYANMIGIRSDEVMSEKARRKAAQKALREKKDEEDRQRAIQDAMEMAASTSANDAGQHRFANGDIDDMDGNHVDVHLRGFNLPNKKGAGTDLLVDANLTLSKGRRYGLMG